MESDQSDQSALSEKLTDGISDLEKRPESSVAGDETSLSGAEPESGIENTVEQPNLLLAAGVLSVGMIALAIILGWLGFCDTRQSLWSLDRNQVLFPALVWGIGASIPLLFLPFAILKFDFGLFQSLKQTIDDLLIPLFKECSFAEIVLLSAFAGLSEEIFFRWCLQGGLTNVWAGNAGVWLGISIAGVLFGLCHFITVSYALFAALMGIYLGVVMQWSGTYLAPAIAHGLYDFVALSLVVHLGQNRGNRELAG